MICFEPQKALGTASNKNKIQKVMFISEDNIKLYYIKGTEYDEVESKIPSGQKRYFKNILLDAYKAQSSPESAVELRHHICSGNFAKQLKEVDPSLREEWEINSNVIDRECQWKHKTTTEDYKKYNYYGVFVYLGTGAYGSQGRIVYTVIREKKPTDTPTVKVPFEKDDNNGNVITTSKGTFKISFNNTKVQLLNNNTASSVTKTNNKFTLKFKPVNNNGSFDLKVEEISAPNGFKEVEGEARITINYDTSSGKITSINVHGNAAFTNSNKNVGIKMKNEPNLPLFYLKKIDNNRNPISNVTFKVEFDGFDESNTFTTNRKGMTENILPSDVQEKIQSGNSCKVTLKEIQTPERYRAITEPISFYIKWNGTTVTVSNPPQGCEMVSNKSILKIQNDKIEPIWFTIKKVTDTNKAIDLYYRDEGIITKNEDGSYTTLEDKYFAKFRIIAKQNGKTIYEASESGNGDDLFTLPRYVQVDEDSGTLPTASYQTTSAIYPPTNDPIIVTITEVQTPEGFTKAKDIKITFRYNGSIWEPEVSEGEDQLVEFNEDERNRYGNNNKYYPNVKTNGKYLIRTDERKDSEGYITLKYNRSFGIKIKNDRNLIKNVELYKKDQTGANIKGATFKIHFENIEYIKIGDNKQNANSSNTLDIEKTTGSNGLIANIQEIKSKDNSDTVYMTIEEPAEKNETLSGFDTLPAPAKLEFKYNTSSKKWELKVRDGNTLDTSYYNIVNASTGDKFTVNLKDDYKLDKLTILKTDSLYGSKVQGAKFNVTLENVKSVKGYSINSSGTTTLTGVTTNTNDGNIELEDVVISDITKPITITMEETYAPEGYKKIDGKVTVKLIRDGNVYKIIEQSKEPTVLDSEFKVGNATVSESENTVSIGIKDIPAIEELEFLKNDSLDNGNITGAEFKVDFINVQSYYVNGVKKTDTSTTVTVTKGKSLLEKIILADASKSAKITLEEIKAPEGYKKIDGKIYLTVTYTDDGYVITPHKDSNVLDGEFNLDNPINVISKNKFKVNIKDIPALQKLNLFKLDSQDNSNLTGAEFEVNFSNVESYYVNGVKKKDTSTTVTVDEGKALIEKILLKDINSKATITLEETKAPIGYKKLVGKIYLTVEYTNEGYKITATKDETISNKEFNTANVEIKDKKNANVTIKDIPVMNIGGIVWEDKQYGEKLADVDERYKGIPEDINDILLSGVEVYLTDGEPQFDDGRVKNAIAETKTANGGEKVTYVGHIGEVKTTLQKGEYLFAGIEKKDNYYVVFKYDGINYITVEKGTENNSSKVEEKGRAEFNKKFQTIESGRAIADNGSIIELEYNSVDGKSKLITKDNEGNIKPEFVMYAKSDKVNSSDWQNTWTEDGVVNKADSRLNINCGIKDRFFDLAIGMDVESAKLTINGKETTYTYNQILNGELENIDFDKISKNATDGNGNAIEYNLYLYYSDYNYRIDDYKTDESKTIKNNNNIEDGENDYQKMHDNPGEELRAFVTYKVIIKNQSTVEYAKVNKLAYYYDTNYKFYSAKDKYENDIEFTTKGTINGKNYAEINLGENANYLGSDDQYRQELYITFEIDRNSEDYKGLADNNFECANIVEILSYSTIDGLIDHDSAPGNFEPGRYEDDTDEAIGLNIKLRENERKITGTVFDDGRKNGADGKLGSTENKVNDVIVQLIEVKPIENESGITKYYEYIWQETRSGSNTVKTTAKNGSTTESYTNGVVENSGIYEFTNFIPGNYIIRFIYGDGSTYDLTDNVKTYNGQDYQSTKDPNYKSSWYNTAGYVADDNGNYPSVARDNEARRLDVMAYSTMIDNTKGTDLELTSTDQDKIKDTLKNTWMAAETSRINVPVDAETTKTEEDKTEVSFEYIINKIEFNNMNFGLAKRPETKLKLEKHITSLKIVPNGVGVKPIIEAKAKKIEDIVNCTNANGETVELQGVTTGLTAISSTRDNRSFWKVETDIEELAQGATLEVEYTYVIKNDSDEDYLGSELVNQYKTNLDGYSDYLKDLKKSVKAIMRTGQYAYSDINAIGGYLGEFYYTGNKGTSDSPVLSRAETLKESLNEQFGKQSTVGDYFNVRDFDSSKDINTYKDTDGNDVSSGKNISTVIESNSTSEFLKRKAGSNYTDEDADWSKTAKVTTVLSVSSNGTIGGNYPSYIAEITKYSNAAGRRNMEATPGNLSYVHSEATDITMNSVYNEDDEFWGESIIISKPTGEDKLSGVQIAVISTISVAILGAGIILIKKFVLKK